MNLEIAQRFKDCYESRQRFFLNRRIPVIIRCDGRSFHSLTKSLCLEKPFDANFNDAMNQAAIALCKEFNAVIGYVQSDEISLLLLDDKKHNSQAVWDYELNKLISISAATASVYFNKFCPSDKNAVFDSRAFNVPKEDIINYFICRQLDCLRNARNGWSEYALALKMGKKTARRELHGLGASKQVEKVEFETGHLFSDMSIKFRHGSVILKQTLLNDRTDWVVEEDTPWFIDNNDYILQAISKFYGEYSTPEKISMFG